MSNKKDKMGRPSTGVSTKSKGKNGIYDITREITGIDDANDLLFESKRKKVERTINKLKKVSDIPQKINNLDYKNLKEFSQLIGFIINNDEIDEINNRIVNPKRNASLEDYDTLIKLMSEIINQRDDNDDEKMIVNSQVENNYKEIKVMSEIIAEKKRLSDGLQIVGNIMIQEESIKYFTEIRDKLNEINNELYKKIEIHGLLQERVNTVSKKYPELNKLEKIDMNDFDLLPIDFIAEVLGLPTVKDMEDAIKQDIETGEI